MQELAESAFWLAVLLASALTVLFTSVFIIMIAFTIVMCGVKMAIDGAAFVGRKWRG